MNIETFNNSQENYNAAIYIRLSKEDGDKEESESVINQRKILKSFAKEKKIKIYDEYVDDGYSGTNFDRPNFKRMIYDIENGKVNMVITKSLSRLGRDYIETGRYIENYFPEHQVRYIAILDDVDTFLDNNCDTVAFKNIMNDFYAKETSKNVKKTKNRKKQEGFFYTAYAPFGYNKISKSGQLEIDEVQASIVREIFDLFLEGNGVCQIARIMTERNIKPPGLQMRMPNVTNNQTNTTDKWHHNTVRRILHNQIYIGNCVQNKVKKISYKSKKMLTVPIENQVVTLNHHQPIITIEKWNTVQEMLKHHKNAKVRSTDVLMKHLLYCADCNNKLAVLTKVKHNKSGDKTTRYIMCPTAVRVNSNIKCVSRYVNYDEFEKQALEQITNTLELYIKSNAFKDEETLKKVMQYKNNTEPIINKIDTLKDNLNKINSKITMLYNDKLNGIIEEQDFKFFSEGLINERNKIKYVLKETENDFDKFHDEDTNNKIEKNVKNTIRKILKSEAYTKEILDQFINRIEIDKDKHVTIFFNFYELNCIGGQLDVK